MAKTSKAKKTSVKAKPDTKSAAAADPRAAILTALIPHVAFDGWTEELLATGIRRGAYTRAVLDTAFPEGIDDVTAYFPLWADAQMEEHIRKQYPRNTFMDLRVRDRIDAAVRARIAVLTPCRAAVSALVPRETFGFHWPAHVWRTADIIWQMAGDTATDYNRYTKRLLLSGVLVSTILFWLNDTSRNAAQTHEFLARRIDNVLRLGKAISGAKEKVKNKTTGRGA